MQIKKHILEIAISFVLLTNASIVCSQMPIALETPQNIVLRQNGLAVSSKYYKNSDNLSLSWTGPDLGSVYWATSTSGGHWTEWVNCVGSDILIDPIWKITYFLGRPIKTLISGTTIGTTSKTYLLSGLPNNVNHMIYIATRYHHVFNANGNGTDVDEFVDSDLSTPINIYIDTKAPDTRKVSLSPNVGVGNWTNQKPTISIDSCADEGSGFKQCYAVIDSKEQIQLSINSSYVFSSLPDGGHIIDFHAIDNVENDEATRFSINTDCTAPDLPVINISPSSFGWIKSNAEIWGTNEVDSGSPIKGYQYSLNSIFEDPANSIPTKEKFTLSQDGVYTVYCRAVDGAGNISQSSSVTVKIDKTPPVLSPNHVAILGSDGNIHLSWDASDETSGIATCYLKHIVDGSSVDPIVAITSTGSNYTAVIPVDSNNLQDSTAAFTITAVDNAGNEAISNEASIPIPPAIHINDLSVDTTQADKNYMEVDIPFDLSPEKIKDTFAQLVFTRTQGDVASGMTLPDLVIDTSTIQISAAGKLVPSDIWKVWKTDGDTEYLCYRDLIPVASGAGHKSWRYTFTPYLKDPAIIWAVSAGQTKIVALPNNPGSIASEDFEILDTNDTPSSSPDFKIGADGAVHISFRGSDPDRDDWTVEIDKVNQVSAVSGGQPYTLTSYASLNGKNKLSYPYTNGYAPKVVPVVLPYGDSYIQICWTEGSDTGTVVRSSIKHVVFRHSAALGYTLTVFDGYGSPLSDTTAGITCAPWQPLVFGVTATDTGSENGAAIHWDFGEASDPTSIDPSDAATADGLSVTHRYKQDTGQAESFINRTLTITLTAADTSTTTVELPIRVQDTQLGELWGDETWHGAHSIVGVVVVPLSMNLHIASSATVEFRGGLGSGYSQGIKVKGNLAIDGGVTLAAATDQTQGWDTILAEGTATIGSATGDATVIRNANRAIAANTSAVVALANTTLMNNETGLHVVGNANVSVVGCRIIDNTLYGIKEDGGGRPIVVDSILRGNFRNYYKWDGGLLNIGEINKLAQNSGNRGE